MEKFKDYQKTVSNAPSSWLIDCVLEPSDSMRLAHVDLILLEITRRIWNGQDACPCLEEDV